MEASFPDGQVDCESCPAGSVNPGLTTSQEACVFCEGITKPAGGNTFCGRYTERLVFLSYGV